MNLSQPVFQFILIDLNSGKEELQKLGVIFEGEEVSGDETVRITVLSDPGYFRVIDALVLRLTDGKEGVEVLNVAVQKEGEARCEIHAVMKVSCGSF